ncbi:MAG: DUF3828 domain-containing protein [Bosea sp. (in: a-proteobacteria)]|uniref:DUF3828 domain-containing protein n=1 Tax=Bosea sp. (in: a-proteobacteria) TaxID=1871050 RepID=UPI0027373BCB|nr:DUF3828 domain-containing protein [Bosea sp. (in: a-proteobacteria)]MDP3603955.1 DUF3828 domain-containing protein [Bosea sp. (in: a-proteobacteria)]
MNQSRRSVSRWLAATAGLIIAATLSAGAVAAPAGPETPVREAYAITTRQLAGSGGKPVAAPWQKPHRDRLMSRALAGMFARDELYQDEAGEMGHLGADPFLSGQDGEIKNLKVSVTSPPAGGKAQVTASFRSFKQPVSVRFRMVEEGGAWKIDDIVNRVEGQDYAVRDLLSQPYECGSFMKKPCTR